MSSEIPRDAQCVGCGYLLRGLDEPVCPECSRAFDPGDPRTYTTDPRRRRRRRIIIWGVIPLLMVLAYVLGPRGVMNAQLTFTYPDNGRTFRAWRWELQPPRWFPLRYPSFRWSDESPGSAPPTPGEPCTLDVTAKYALGVMGGSTSRPEECVINGVVADPDHAAEILKALLSPTSNGIRFGPRPTAAPNTPQK